MSADRPPHPPVNPYEPPQAVAPPWPQRAWGRLLALELARLVVLPVAAVALSGTFGAVVLLVLLLQSDRPLAHDPPLPLIGAAALGLAALFGAMWVADRWLVRQLRGRP